MVGSGHPVDRFTKEVAGVSGHWSKKFATPSLSSSKKLKEMDAFLCVELAILLFESNIELDTGLIIRVSFPSVNPLICMPSVTVLPLIEKLEGEVDANEAFPPVIENWKSFASSDPVLFTELNAGLDKVTIIVLLTISWLADEIKSSTRLFDVILGVPVQLVPLLLKVLFVIVVFSWSFVELVLITVPVLPVNVLAWKRWWSSPSVAKPQPEYERAEEKENNVHPVLLIKDELITWYLFKPRKLPIWEVLLVNVQLSIFTNRSVEKIVPEFPEKVDLLTIILLV